ncbi:MAG: dTMP kinase [Holophagae bacterium]|nr:MAG: dTMP kinase [Holophagae bacterium]
MLRGWFITFEGGEGTGKSTQIGRLADVLRERGLEVVVTREPGGTTLAEAVRALLLDPAHDLDGLTEIFLLEAARHDHVERVIRPALRRGAVVLCDRFADSSWVYQGVVRGLGEEAVERLNLLATGGLEPDLTLVLDMEPAAALGRALDRNSAAASRESRLDEEPLQFHERVWRGFHRLAERYSNRVRLVAADASTDEVFRRVLAALPAELV